MRPSTSAALHQMVGLFTVLSLLITPLGNNGIANDAPSAQDQPPVTPTEPVVDTPTATAPVMDTVEPAATESPTPFAATLGPSATPTEPTTPTPLLDPTQMPLAAEPIQPTQETTTTTSITDTVPGQILPFIGEIWGTIEGTYPGGGARFLSEAAPLDAQDSSGGTPFSSSFSGHQEGLFVADVNCAYGTVRVQGTYTITAILGGSTHFDVAVHYDGAPLNVMSLDTFAGSTSLSQYQLASRDLGAHTFDQTWAIYDRAAELQLWTNDVEGNASGTFYCQPYATKETRLTQNLAAYYPLDETQGARFNAITEIMPLLNYGTVDSDAGVVNAAARFVKAETDFLVVDDNASTRSGDKDFTIAAWIKPTAYNFNGCGLHYVTKLGGNYDYTLATSHISGHPVWVYQNAGVGQPDPFPLNEWVYVVGGYDRAAHRAFLSVNGNPAVYVDYSASDALASAGQFLVGAYAVWNGQCGAVDAVIDELGVWNRMLQPAEIVALYNNGAGCAFPFSSCSQPVQRRSIQSASAIGDVGVCSTCEYMRSVGDPINTLTGAVDFSVQDLSFPALGGELEFVRTYSTDIISNTTQLAPGWTHSLDTRLIFADQPGGISGQVLVKLHSANEFVFYEVVNSAAVGTPQEYSYVAYPGVLATLERDTTNHEFLLTTRDQGVYRFKDTPGVPDHGKLISWTDPQGHAQTYAYDPTTGLLTGVTAGDRALSLMYVDGRLQSVQDHTRRSVSFGYDANGDLAAVTDVRGEVWTYAYDGTSHRLATVTDPDGRIIERNEYYPDGRAWRQFNGANQVVVELTYTVNPDSTISVVITDGNNNAETLTYDALGTLVSSDSASGSIDKVFDGNFHAEAVSDENGNATQYLWSHDGQVLTQTVDALGNDTLFQYDALNNITRTMDARGNVTTALYDGTLLTATTNALDQQTLYTYTTAADAPQPAGLLKAMSNAAGETTTYGYNAFGQPLTMTNAAGQTMSYAYDALGRVTSTTDYSGRVTLTDYNATGQVVTTTANYLAGQPQNFQNLYNLITVHNYDGAGRLRWTRDTEGRTDWTCYDAAGRVNRTVQNATGDGLTPATDPCDAANYVASSDPAEDRIATTVYDDAGNVSATIDAAGIVSRTYYDDSSRPYLSVQSFTGSDLTGTITSTIPAWTTIYPDRNVRSQTVYDPAGNVVQTIDNAGLISATCYDALNRPVKTVQNPTVADPCGTYTPSGAPDQDLTETTTYDENGNVLATTDPLGRVTRTWYDVLNRPITVTVNFTGDLADLSAPAYDPGQPDRNLTTETVYDAAGRAYKSVDGVLGRADWTCYDETGRVTRTVQNAQGDPCGMGWTPSSVADEDVATTYTYDTTTGRQIAVTAADGQITRTYFDETGRQAAQTANLTGQAITAESVPAYNGAFPDQNVTTRWGYDVLGRTITTTVAAGSAQAQTTYTCYDALGRVAKTVLNPTVADPCGSYTPSSQTDRDVATSYTYDAAGHQIAATDALGRITRTYYDDLGRTTAVVANLTGQGIAVETVPAFDPAYPDRNVRAFTSYDDAGRVLETTDNAGLVTRSTYDSLGRTITTTVNYVSGGPVDDVTNLASGTVYDKLGNVTRSVDAEGVQTGFDYDWVGRLITVTENLVVPGITTESQNVRTGYAYDGRGNRLTITDGRGKLTTFTYDDLDRQRTEQDALGNTWTTTYTKVGVTISLLDANGQTTGYAYDDLRRVTAIDYPAGTADVGFTYDALGNRSTMTDGTGVTSWALDALNRPITITAPSGAVGYGYDRLGNRTTLRYPDSKAVTYTVDALNRIASVQDWASAFTSYTYNAAGQVVTTTLPNSVRTVYGYDAAQRLQSLAHSTTTQTLGAYTYTVNAVGNRTAVTETQVSLETTAASPDLFDTIYADGFEAGDLAGWNATSGTGLSVSSAAAYTGTLGFSVAITNTTARFVQSLLPTAEKHYRARFSFDPNTITMTSGSAHFIFRGFTGTATDVVQVEFRRNGANYELRAGGRNDASAYTYTPWTVITDAAHWVELDWQASTAAGANNGAVALWIDQAAAGSVTNLDNDTRLIDTVTLGAVNGLDTGTTGTVYFDAFEDRRVHTTIGTEASLPDRLFTHSFENNSLGNWTPSGTGITVTAAANLAPGQTLGASIAITNTTARYLGDLTPNRESRYRARFYVDPNTLTMTNGNAFYLMAIYTGTTEIGRVELQKGAAGYQVRVNARNDASVWTNTAWVNLTDAAHYLEIDWQAATAPGANNGSLGFWLDGVAQGTLSNLDNDTRRVDLVRIGAVSGLDTGTTGTLYLDAFEGRRSSAIGPVQVAGNALTTTAIAYGYDPLYRLTGATYSDGTLFGYAYDAVGNVLTKTQTISGTPATQTYAYDDANRQTSAAGLAQTYDNNGNLTHDGATAYTWDGANRMTASGSTAYTYNGLNDRVSAGGATHQLDLNAGLTQVLADGSNTYLYGAGRLGEQQAVAWQYHLADGLGSVRQLADASGAVSATKNYEPYGEVLSSAGTASSVYGFTGEQMSGSLVHLRARYYQTEQMRFISRDAWAGDPARPRSYNRFGYAYGNVTNWTDPSGRDCSILTSARDRAWCARSGNGAGAYGLLFTSERGLKWKMQDIIAVTEGTKLVGKRLSRLLRELGRNVSPMNAYLGVYGNVNWYRTSEDLGNSVYCARLDAGSNLIPGVKCGPDGVEKLSAGLVAHELGHVFNSEIANRITAKRLPADMTAPYTVLHNGGIFSPSPTDPTAQVHIAGSILNDEECMQRDADGKCTNFYYRTDLGYLDDSQYNEWTVSAAEDFADMYTNWVTDTFRADNYGRARRAWMDATMSTYVSAIFGIPSSTMRYRRDVASRYPNCP